MGQGNGFAGHNPPSYRNDSDRAETEAYWEAVRRALAERDRVAARQRQLEIEERETQRKLEEQRRIDRQNEMMTIEKARKEEVERRRIEREKMEQLLKKQSQEKIEEEAKEFHDEKLKSKSPQNTYLKFKQLNTLQTIQQIGNKVKEVAMFGKIVTERVDIISTELTETLQDDYQLIKSEIDTYKKYGKQMESMTDLFIKEFQNAFNIIENNTADKYLKKQEEIKEIEQEINQEDDEETKEMLKEELPGLNALDNAIKNVETKLFLMEQYYDEMITDYKCFRSFIDDKQDEVDGLTNKFKSVAKTLRDDVYHERDIFDGKNDEQQVIFQVDYNYEQRVYKSTDGCIFGRIWRKLAGPRDEDLVGFGKTETKSGSIFIEGKKETYKGKDQAVALEEIAQKVEDCDSYKKLKQELIQLKSDWKIHDDYVNICKRRKKDVKEMSDDIRGYKLKMKELKEKFRNGDDVSDNQKKLINKKLQGLCVNIQSIIQTMK